jgi:hypothetical protein
MPVALESEVTCSLGVEALGCLQKSYDIVYANQS